MIYGALLSHFDAGMENHTAEVMDAQTFADLTTGRDGYTGRDFDKTLHKKPEGLGGNTVAIAPVKEPVDKQGLEAGRKNASN
jgi:hypothetical protein